MRTKKGTYWETWLPKGSQALEDLDAFCEEMGGLSRGEATRLLLIAWSKARRGAFSSLWGMQSASGLHAHPTDSSGASPPMFEHRAVPDAPQKAGRSRANAAAAALLNEE